MNVLVIGGTLFIGRLLVKELLGAGHQVSVLHRKPKHDLPRRVENLVADRNDAASVRSALENRRFEAVFDNVYDWQRGTTAEQVQATVHACGGRLARYVFMSSVAAYGDGLNHYEGDALAPDDHPEPYVRDKARTERLLFRMHQRTGLPVVTFRPPFIYGPGNPFYREAFFWDRLRLNRPIIVPGDGHRLMQFCYVKDLVAACLQVL
ncbi:MAG: NAD-dependent epimerase/dehydratase family protein, partial [Acidobacteria bacterium]|nr:NAD-dependent epimerase/dehydratase family protein [Acidobacteriota bacterium]